MDYQSTRQASTSPLIRSPLLGATYVGDTKTPNREDIIIELFNRHETSVSELQKYLATKSDDSQQVMLLEAIHRQLASQSTPLQFIWNAVLQTLVIGIAFLFGMFSIFAWHGQLQSNKIATQANQIALVSLCLTNNVTTRPCADVISKANDALGNLLTGYIDGVDTAGFSTWPWIIPRDTDSTILIIYIVIPVLAGGLGTYASWKIYHERGRQLGVSHP